MVGKKCVSKATLWKCSNAGDQGSIPGHPLEKGMAIHSSILAWRIPWTEKTGGYSSWGRKESDMTE